MTKPDTVTISLGPTINLGDYSSLRTMVSITYDPTRIKAKTARQQLVAHYLATAKEELHIFAEFNPKAAKAGLRAIRRLTKEEA